MLTLELSHPIDRGMIWVLHRARKIHRAGCFAIFGCLLAIAPQSKGSTDEVSIALANGGTRVTQIQLSDTSGPTLRFAATELQRYIEQMSGATLEIVGADPADHTGALRLIARSGDDSSFQDKSAFQLHTLGNALLIEGASEYAVLIGVYDWLGRLGCRWLGPGTDVIPHIRPLLIQPIDDTQTPAFRWRGLELISGSTPDIIDWMAKSKLNVAWPEAYLPEKDLRPSEKNLQSAAVPEMITRGMTIFWGGHILPVLMPCETYREHPEYFAEIAGKRLNPEVALQERNQLCVSNPGSLQTLTENTIRFLRNHPWVDVLFLWAGDTTQWCECQGCRDLLPEPDEPSPFGGLDRTSLYACMVKAVADGVAIALPERHVAFNHYYNLEEIPRNRDGSTLTDILPPRSVISAVDDYHQCDRHPLTDADCPRGKRIQPIAAMWAPYYDDTVSWSYYFAWNFTKGLPLSEVSKIPEDFRFLRGLGITGIVDNVSLEPGSIQWNNNLPNFCAYSRAAWNPSVSSEDIVHDFATGAYGPAAAPMEEVWRLLDSATQKYGMEPGYLPTDPALAAPDVLHGRMVDAPKPAGAGQTNDLRLLLPNENVAQPILQRITTAQNLLGNASNSPSAFRLKTLRSTLEGWNSAGEPCSVFGFLNGGARYRYAIYGFSNSSISCDLTGGNNLGDCFPLRDSGSEQLASVGDSVEITVQVRTGAEETGSPSYRSGPGLYQAEDSQSVCGAQGAHNLNFFIGNLDSDRSGPCRVIAMAHDGAFGTALCSSSDNVWGFGQNVTLRIRYARAQTAGHTYEYAYKTSDTWTVISSQTFVTRLPFVAPSIHFAFLDPARVKYPITAWASLSALKSGHGP